MSNQATLFKLKSGQLLNPVFPVRGLYSHSTFEPNPDPNEKPLEIIHYESTTKELGDECVIQVLGPIRAFEKSPFLAHSMQVGSYRIFESHFIKGKLAHPGYLEGGAHLTHLNTICVRLVAFGSDVNQGQSIRLDSVLEGYDSFPSSQLAVNYM